MEIEVKIEELRKKKIFVATPMYGGMCNGMYTKSTADLATIATQYGMDVRFFYLFNESLITRARNYLVDEFLRSPYTHLMFIDSDIHFNPNDVLTLAALDKEIIGAPIPKKLLLGRRFVTQLMLDWLMKTPLYLKNLLVILFLIQLVEQQKLKYQIQLKFLKLVLALC